MWSLAGVQLNKHTPSKSAQVPEQHADIAQDVDET